MNYGIVEVPAISAEKEDDRIAVYFLSPPTKPTICRLYLNNNEVIDSIEINLQNWRKTYYFKNIDVYSQYKVNCGLGDSVNLQSNQFEYYTQSLFIEPNQPSSSNYSMIKVIGGFVVVLLIVFFGYYYYRKMKSSSER